MLSRNRMRAEGNFIPDGARCRFPSRLPSPEIADIHGHGEIIPLLKSDLQILSAWVNHKGSIMLCGCSSRTLPETVIGTGKSGVGGLVSRIVDHELGPKTSQDGCLTR